MFRPELNILEPRQLLAFDPKTILAACMLGTPKPKPLHNSLKTPADVFADYIGP